VRKKYKKTNRYEEKCDHYCGNEKYVCDTNEHFECLIEEFDLLNDTQFCGIKALLCDSTWSSQGANFLTLEKVLHIGTKMLAVVRV
jgi:hypothetical protein